MLGLSALSVGIKAIDGITNPDKVKDELGSIIASLVAIGGATGIAVSGAFPADIASLGTVTQFNTTIPGPAPSQGMGIGKI